MTRPILSVAKPWYRVCTSTTRHRQTDGQTDRWQYHAM